MSSNTRIYFDAVLIANEFVKQHEFAAENSTLMKVKTIEQVLNSFT
jgi:hypothetical protein